MLLVPIALDAWAQAIEGSLPVELLVIYGSHIDPLYLFRAAAKLLMLETVG